MKTKTLFLLSLLINTVVSVFSQNFTSDFSEGKYDIKNYYSRRGIQTKMGQITLKENVRSYGGFIDIVADEKASIVVFNEKMEKVKETEVVFKNSKFINVKGLFQIKGKTILVYSYKNSKKDTEYSISAIKINETDISLGQEVELGKFPTQEGKAMPDFEMSYSFDSSKYLLFVEADQKKKEMKQFYFGVFNGDLIRQYEKNVELPIEKRYVVIDSRTLDKKGNLFIEVKQFEKEVKDRKSIRDEEHGTPPYTTTIKQYSPDGKVMDEIALKLGEKYLHSSSLLFNNKSDKINIAGTYKTNIKGRVTGIFNCDYDPVSKTVTGTKMSEIPDDLLNLFDKEQIASTNKKDPGISGNFRAKRFSYRENGTIDYALEYDRCVEVTTANMSGTTVTGGVSSYYAYDCMSILNVNIDAAGKMIFTRIPKAQSDDNSHAYISHYSFYSGSKLIFLYNDDKDNFERDINKAPDNINMYKNSRKSVLMAAIVDEKGNLERKIVYEHKEDKYVTLTDNLYMIAPNKILCVRSKTGSFLADIQHSKVGLIELKP